MVRFFKLFFSGFLDLIGFFVFLLIPTNFVCLTHSNISEPVFVWFAGFVLIIKEHSWTLESLIIKNISRIILLLI